MGGNDVVARTILIPNLRPAPVTEIPAGRTAVLVLDDVYDTRAQVPAEVTHRLAVTLGPPSPEYQPTVSNRYPDSVTQIGGAVGTSTASPVVIGPPLAGDDWVAVNGCCVVASHRGAVMGVGGRLNGSERFAIDWVRIDPTKNLATTFTGDGKRNEDYLAFDAPLLAVADGTIAKVVSDMKEATPQVIMPNQAFEELGDKVTRGQVIGRLGNSGNTSEAHLHFHVSQGAIPLSNDNVPYEIDQFAFAGSIDGDHVALEPKAAARTNQLPLDGNTINFPAT